MWIQAGVTVRKRLRWVMTSVTLTFASKPNEPHWFQKEINDGCWDFLYQYHEIMVITKHTTDTKIDSNDWRIHTKIQCIVYQIYLCRLVTLILKTKVQYVRYVCWESWFARLVSVTWLSYYLRSSSQLFQNVNGKGWKAHTYVLTPLKGKYRHNLFITPEVRDV